MTDEKKPPEDKKPKKKKRTTEQIDALKARGVVRTKEQSKEALRRKAKMFYDLQRMRLQVSGRIQPKAEGAEIQLTEYDQAILEHRAEDLHTAEKFALADVEEHLEDIPLWTQVLNADRERWKGIGPTMAGVIISEFDVEKADTASKFWAFAGLAPVAAHRCKKCNTVVDFHEGEKIPPPPDPVAVRIVAIVDEKTDYEIDIPNLDSNLVDDLEVDTLKLTEVFAIVREEWDIPIQDDFKLGDFSTMRHIVEFVRRSRPDLEPAPVATPPVPFYTHTRPPAYIKGEKVKCPNEGKNLSSQEVYESGKAAKPVKGQKLPYNSFLRSKMVGVLGPILLKVNSPYRKYYDDFKMYWASAKKGRNDGHRHQAAIRYMVKQLLADIWEEWRRIAGLPGRKSYAEEKLGRVHRGGIIQNNQRPDESPEDMFIAEELKQVQEHDAKHPEA